MTVPARILPSPPVRYTIRPPPNSNQEKASTETRDVHVDHGKWILGGLSFNRYSKLTNPKGGHTWLALNLGSPNPARLQAIQRQMQQFQAELHGLGVKVGPFGPTENLQVNRDFAATLMPKLRALKRDGLQLVVIVLPGDKDIGLYKTIKQVADVKVGIHNVVVRAEDRKQNGFLNCGVEYLANIGQKMSLKLGGWNQSVQDLGIINDGRTMLMGLDVTVCLPKCLTHFQC